MSKHKISCDVAMDLIPIYIDGALSKESEELVRRHVEDCEKCQKAVEDMEVDLGQWKDEDISLFKKTGKAFRKMYFLRAFLVLLFILILLAVWFVATAFMLEDCRPIWPKSSVEGLQENLHVVQLDGDYYIHQEDIYAKFFLI
jgi:hypothetical protein